MTNTISLMAPKSVTVNYSEAKIFNPVTYTFEQFESLAERASTQKGIDGSCFKVSVTVELYNHRKFNTVLNLALDEDYGLAHHVFNLRKSWEEYPDDKKIQDKIFIELIESIDLSMFDADLVNAKIESSICAINAEKMGMEEAAKNDRIKRIEQDRKKTEDFRNSLVIPENVKAVIVAQFREYDHENSDPMGDYHRVNTTRTILLAWSTHTRDTFSEMRKAASNHPDTKHLSDKENSTENREKYSMGRGYYLTEKGQVYEGIEIRKLEFYGSQSKKSHIPFGEVAIPGVQYNETENSECICENRNDENSVEKNTLELDPDIVVRNLIELPAMMLKLQSEKFEFQKANIVNPVLILDGGSSVPITVEHLESIIETNLLVNPAIFEHDTVTYFFDGLKIKAAVKE